MAKAKRSKKVERVGGGQAVCFFCGNSIPDAETARTTETPPGQLPLPAGSGWVICGDLCKKLPEGAIVFYRKRGTAWDM